MFRPPQTRFLRRATRRARGPHRFGLTLVELLVVITILVMLVGVTIPLVRMVGDDQPVDEAAKIFEMQMASAQARAVSKGRDAAVVLLRDGVNNASYELAIAESPPPYAGETTNARAVVTQQLNSNGIPEGVVEFQGPVRPMQGFIQPGDMIRFNFREPEYVIVNLRSANNIDRLRVRPMPSIAMNLPIPFQIIRAPRVTSESTVELPTGSYVELNPLSQADVDAGLAGPSTNHPFADDGALPEPRDIQLVFSPRGKLYRIYGAAAAFNQLNASVQTSPSDDPALLARLPAMVIDPIEVSLAGGAVGDNTVEFQRTRVRVRVNRHLSAMRRQRHRNTDVANGPMTPADPVSGSNDISDDGRGG